MVAVLARGGRVLVIRRGLAAPRAGYWMPPSGRVEPGESHPETLVREVREELGLAVRPGQQVWQSDTDDGAYRLYWWTGEVDDTELVINFDEVSEARWVTPQEFRRLAPTFPSHQEFMQKILPGLGVLRRD